MDSGTSLRNRVSGQLFGRDIGTGFKRALRAAHFHFIARFTTPPGHARAERILRIISEVEF